MMNLQAAILDFLVRFALVAIFPVADNYLPTTAEKITIDALSDDGANISDDERRDIVLWLNSVSLLT